MAQPTDRLLSQLNQTQLAQKDNPTYQVIKQLIDRIKSLESLLGSSSGGSSIINETTIIQQILGGDGGGGDGEIGPPGVAGVQGIPGITGAMGPVTLGPMGLDADSPEEPWMIPGVIGPQGNQGPSGSHTLVMLGMDGYDGEDGLTIPSGGSGSSPWILISSQSPGGASTYDFTNLSEYSEILVYTNDVTRSNAVTTALRISTDNGATYLSTNIYSYVDLTGVESGPFSALGFFQTGATAARSGYIHIWGFNIAGAPKVAYSSRGDFPTGLIEENGAFNALRITVSVGTLSGGIIYVFGRK